MPPSQLKKLKASLHEQRTSKVNGGKPATQAVRGPASRPQRKKETPAQRADRIRKDTLLPELQRRHKVGGIVDRRIGENDPTLAPEDRMLQRYAAEAQRSKRTSIFNLEDEADGENEEETLTHLGMPVRNDKGGRFIDDYDAGEDDDDAGDGLLSRSKRKMEDAIEEVTRAQEVEIDGQPARKKTKKEVMEEVIAKSKFHKHERQQVKEDDEDVREQLNKGMPDLLAALRGDRRKPPPPDVNKAASGMNGIHADRAALINGGVAKDAEYDKRLRQLADDKRAQPTQRTKTEEEKAEDEAKRLERLEAARQRRMRGEAEKNSDESEDEQSEGEGGELNEDEAEAEEAADEAAEFGFTNAQSSKPTNEPTGLDVEDEDDFMIDEDLVDSGSDVDTDFDSAEEDDDSPVDAGEQEQEDDDAEFLADVLPSKPDSMTGANTVTLRLDPKDSSLAYTYPSPQTHGELLQVLKNVPTADTTTVIQRIRALYHPSLAAENKNKLAAFAVSLVDHLHYLPGQTPPPSLAALESIIRHVHSLSRTFALPVAQAFRTHLERMHQQHPRLEAGDLTVLTAIGTIYPTSDHFHQVVTPAVTLVARWLSTTSLSGEDSASTVRSRTGAYLVALCIRYQRLARRYVPETIRFTLQALSNTRVEKLTVQHIGNLQKLAELWREKTAFIDMFTPGATSALQRLTSNSSTRKGASPAQSAIVSAAASTALSRLNIMLDAARLARRPLELHHHLPQPIKSSIPQFETSFNPAKHYDPDRERAESSKLRKEHRREKKGALRELRRDAEFVTRQKLADKKERDRAYEDKFRRIVGGIEREEGHEAKSYEREKAARKGKRF